MKTEVFENTLQEFILTNPDIETAKKWNESKYIQNTYLFPIQRELSKNLAGAINKEDVVKHYLLEIKSLAWSVEVNENLKELIYSESINHEHYKGIRENLSISLVLNSINFCCIIYKVNFKGICAEMNFNLKLYLGFIDYEIELPKFDYIFAKNGFILFQYIHDNYIRPIGSKGRFEDVSYYVQKLKNDRYIPITINLFKDWFIEQGYDTQDFKIKTVYQTENPDRKRNYSNALDWFKQQPMYVP
jgi:hypothetical protein